MKKLHSAHWLTITHARDPRLGADTSEKHHLDADSSHIHLHLSHAISTSWWREEAKPDLIEIKQPLIRRIQTQNTNYISDRKIKFIAHLRFWPALYTCPHAYKSDTVWSSPTIPLLHESLSFKILRGCCCNCLR